VLTLSLSHCGRRQSAYGFYLTAPTGYAVWAGGKANAFYSPALAKTSLASE